MLDKVRLPASAFSSCFLFLILSLIISGCVLFWCHNVYQETGNPGYSLLFPGNNYTYIPQPFSINDLSSNDESTLIDIKNFKFIINHDNCNATQLLLLILIHSAPNNFNKRNIIRETWAEKSSSILTFFLIGWSDDYQAELEQENMKYGDLIQGNFLDSYRNMTYKHVMALKWATYYCPSTKYILKLDDDVFVNIRGMLNFLNYDLSPWGARRLLLCDPLFAKVKRSYRSKWRVSPREYPGRHYPVYCSGYVILYSPDTAFILYREAQREPYFWIDDVHITGTIAQKVNITQVSLHSLVLTQKEKTEILNNPFFSKRFLFGPANLQENDIRALHNVVISYSTL